MIRFATLLLALLMAMFLQTGLCPACITRMCESHAAPVKAPEPDTGHSCCSAKAAATIVVKSEQTCSNCERQHECNGNCFTRGDDHRLLLNVSTAETVSPEVNVDVRQATNEPVVTDDPALVAARIETDTGPPGDISGLITTTVMIL